MTDRRIGAGVLLAAIVLPMTGAAASDWRTMHSQTYPPTMAAATQQCQLAANEESGDQLTNAVCDRFGEALSDFFAAEVAQTSSAQPACHYDHVPNGVTYAFLGMQVLDLPQIARGQTKALDPAKTPALVCNIDSLTFHWFSNQAFAWAEQEESAACNNLGVILPTPAPPRAKRERPVPKIERLAAPQMVPQKPSRRVGITRSYIPQRTIDLGGVCCVNCNK